MRGNLHGVFSLFYRKNVLQKGDTGKRFGHFVVLLSCYCLVTDGRDYRRFSAPYFSEECRFFKGLRGTFVEVYYVNITRLGQIFADITRVRRSCIPTIGMQLRGNCSPQGRQLLPAGAAAASLLLFLLPSLCNFSERSARCNGENREQIVFD